MLLAALVLVLGPRPAAPAPQDPIHLRPGPELWISREQLLRLPNSGPEWARVLADADRPFAPDLTNKDDRTDTYVMAASFVWVRNRIPGYRDRVRQACAAVVQLVPPAEDHPPNELSQAWSRNITGYVIAAGLVGLPVGLESTFKRWVASALPHMRRVHRTRPNNIGTHAGAARLAIALYLGDLAEEQQAWDVFRRWLGDDSSPFNFEQSSWGGSECSWAWQGEPYPHFFGINRPGTVGTPCAGPPRALPVPSGPRDISGALPDDQRRGELQSCACPPGPGACCFRWPPRKTNYVYEALQGVLAQAVMHARRGRDPWFIAPDPFNGHGSILRAYEWLRDVAQHPISDAVNGHDDYWQAYLVNQVYRGLPGFAELDEIPSGSVGKAVGYTDWTALESSWP